MFKRVPVSLAFVVLVATLAFAQDLPNRPKQPQCRPGEVRINILKAGFIVGIGGGTGTLNYQGQTYRLSVGGIGIGSLGIADVELIGTASNLRSPSDIAGPMGQQAPAPPLLAAGRL
jgi:hypothetical protein